MAMTYKKCEELFDETVKNLNTSRNIWTRLLKTMSNTYKYDFEEQILIYAQYPHAVACASFDDWSKKLHHTINKNVSGIALFDKSTSTQKYPKLRYVYDMSMTTPKANYKRPYIWYVDEKTDSVVNQRLSSKHKLKGRQLDENIIELVQKEVLKIDDTEFQKVYDLSDGTMVGDLDFETFCIPTKRFVEESLQYIILSRCGFDTSMYFDDDSFNILYSFDRRDIILAIGNLINKKANEMLCEIELIVKQERKKQYEQKNGKIQRNQWSDALPVRGGYDLLSDNKVQRGEWTSLHTGRENIHISAEPNSGRTGTGVSLGQMGQYENEISGRKQPRTVSDNVVRWEALPSLGGDREVGRGNEGTINQADDGATRSERGTQRQGLADISSKTDDDISTSRGNSEAGINLQVKQENEETATEEKSKVAVSVLENDNVKNQIIGNAEYRYIPKKRYRKVDSNLTDIICKHLQENNIKFSGNIVDGKTTFTVSQKDVYALDEVIKNIGGKSTNNDFSDNNYEQIALLSNETVIDERQTAVTEFINNCLLVGTGFENGKYRVQKYFSESHTKSELAEFLKDEYGWGGSYCKEYNISSEPKGLTLQKPNPDNHNENIINIQLSWLQAAEYIKKLVDKNEYFTEQDKQNRIKSATYKYKNYINSTHSEDIIHFQEAKAVFDEYNIEYPALENNVVVVDNIENINENVNQTNNFATITCEWSESSLFEDGKTYSVADFDRIMKSADDDWVKKRQYEIDTYGNDFDKIYEAYENGEIDGINQGYDKVKFTINMPNGEQYTFRQDIGDGDGGVIDFIKQYGDKYKDIVSELERARNGNVYNEDFVEIKTPYYKLQDDNLDLDSISEKYQRNINAIKTLKHIESENRQTTADEQDILAQYVGWGGLDKYFIDDNNSELKSLLTDDEYSSAISSVLNAYYTPSIIIKSMYQALENMGFTSGKILEPSCGVGKFIGLMPQKIAENSKITGIELDSISGRLAKQLYPQADIQVCGFERSKVKENYFDVAIGNVPFGDNRVYDPKYNKRNFLIHDYFFAKSLDLVKPNGVVAFITTKGTLDKKSTKVRKYLAERATLIGVVRLPNNAFSRTSVTSDIIFLQKREKPIKLDDTNTPNWVNISPNADNIVVNNYFVEHPEMILGKMEMVSSRFGKESACIANPNTNLSDQLNNAIKNLKAEIKTIDIQEEITDSNIIDVPVPIDLKNYSFFVFENNVYFKENENITKISGNKSEIECIKNLIKLRDMVRNVLDSQVYDCSDSELSELQQTLNTEYDEFVKKFGRIADKKNKEIFKQDTSMPLLLSLEKYDSNNNFVRKADIFTKRTIKAKKIIDVAENSLDALAISMSNTAQVDIEYMSQLTGFKEEKIISDLKGVIYKDPIKDKYVMADEYLSGDIREKLEVAKTFQKIDSQYNENVAALEQAMPKPLEASEINVGMGATWIDTKYYQEFLFELLGTPFYERPQKYDRPRDLSRKITVSFCEQTGEFFVSNKSSDKNNINATNIYGLPKLNAYHLFEDCLNLRRSKINKKIIDEDGKEKSVVDKAETEKANAKQDLIKEKFSEWIFRDKERRDDIVETYNKKFNNIKPREYNGKYLEFVGINPEITLMEHQKNAIAHALYGGNTLLAHCVGAGKTFEMITIAMEGKRLGLHNKSLFCVPNHLTEQVGNDFLFLYPNANILVATTKDFKKENRKELFSKIATNDYDAVIIGHSQLEDKITVSAERQKQFINQQLSELEQSIIESNDNFTIRELESAKKKLEKKLKELIEAPKHDDVVSFEELGIDKLFLDEAHEFKNLRLTTKMQNVTGIQKNNKTQKTVNLYMICQYLDSITNGKGIVFATGTPVSNSMCEIYHMQKYLQDSLLRKYGLYNFDAWAANFGEVVTKPQLAPEGNTYRPKTSFSKFHNLPELMSMFKECADIKTADTLNLPVPKCEIINVTAKPSELQKELVQTLSERADKIHSGKVPQEVDNMLKITNDGKEIGLDPRIINPNFPDFKDSKVNKCVENVYNIWQETKEQKSTQLIFCDFSTPKDAKTFSVYYDIKNKLISKGIPRNEISFIHDAKDEAEKEILFAKVRNGEVRVLIGSTKKMGAGTNVQDRLIASHDLDAPFRPSDLEQRKGRMVRQGNSNKEVKIFRYITQDTFDAYLFQMLENKQRFISQIMTSKAPVRDCDDIDEVTLSYAETKALCTSNPLIGEKMNLDVEVAKLKILKSSYLNEKYRLEDIYYDIPKKIENIEKHLLNLQNDKKMVDELPKVYDEKGKEKSFVGLKIDETLYMDKEKAGDMFKAAYIKACSFGNLNKKTIIGEYKGFTLSAYFDAFSKLYKAELSNNCTLTVELGESNIGNITRLDNAIASLPARIQNLQNEIINQKNQLSTIKEQLDKPFSKENELKVKSARLIEVDRLLASSSKNQAEDNVKATEISEVKKKIKLHL